MEQLAISEWVHTTSSPTSLGVAGPHSASSLILSDLLRIPCRHLLHLFLSVVNFSQGRCEAAVE